MTPLLTHHLLEDKTIPDITLGDWLNSYYSYMFEIDKVRDLRPPNFMANLFQSNLTIGMDEALDAYEVYLKYIWSASRNDIGMQPFLDWVSCNRTYQRLSLEQMKNLHEYYRIAPYGWRVRAFRIIENPRLWIQDAMRRQAEEIRDIRCAGIG